MPKHSIVRIAFMIATVAAATAGYSSPADWGVQFGTQDPGGGFGIGAYPGCGDGYDGQAAADVSYASVYTALYRQNGPDWSGPTGFYFGDFMAPIPPGASKTWNDIRVWAHNYTPFRGDREWIGLLGTSHPVPPGYWGELVLDYVPASLNWTGPTEFWFSLNVQGDIGVLPIPMTSNPYDPTQVTRMHLTVYAPEPSSLLALLAGLAGFGAIIRRRRR